MDLGDNFASTPNIHEIPHDISHDMPNPLKDDMGGLLHDNFPFSGIDSFLHEVDEMPNIDVEKFYKLVDESQKDLYQGCTKFYNLSFIIRLLHLKCIEKWSDKNFDMLP